MQIRDIVATDRSTLHALLHEVDHFEPHEIRVAEELIAERLAGSADYQIFVAEEETDDGRLVGFICHGHNPVTDAVHDIYWIVVPPRAQRRGVGRALLCHAENRIRQIAGRAITIETSDRPEYQAANG